MKTDRFEKLLSFIARLEDAKIPFALARNRYDGISVEIVAPGERWEVDFLEDGTVDVERFCSDGEISDESMLKKLFELCSDEEPVSSSTASGNSSSSRVHRKKRKAGKPAMQK